MAQEVSIAGSTFEDVPAVYLPDSNNNYHLFTDISDSTLSSNDSMLTSVVAYGANGTKYTGTISINSLEDVSINEYTNNIYVDEGYYPELVKHMPNSSVSIPSSLSGSSATLSAGTNTLTLSKTISATPYITKPGYISSNTVSSNDVDVSLTASVNTRSSSDLTSNVLTVTAPSGYYASNATKTISDANLVAENIKKDVTIFGVTGAYGGGGGGTITITDEANATGTTCVITTT